MVAQLAVCEYCPLDRDSLFLSVIDLTLSHPQRVCFALTNLSPQFDLSLSLVRSLTLSLSRPLSLSQVRGVASLESFSTLLLNPEN
jgi:hypothetical protein